MAARWWAASSHSGPDGLRRHRHKGWHRLVPLTYSVRLWWGFDREGGSMRRGWLRVLTALSMVAAPLGLVALPAAQPAGAAPAKATHIASGFETRKYAVALTCPPPAGAGFVA